MVRRSGEGPIAVIVEVTRVPAVIELPTLDRSARRAALAARPARAIAPAAAARARPRARGRRGDRPGGDGGGPGLPRLVASVRAAGPSCPAGALLVAGVAIFLGVRAVRRWRASRLDELSLAVTLDRYRPGVGQQIADVLQLPDLLDEPGVVVSPAMVRLAVAAGERGPGRFRLALALEPQADGPAMPARCSLGLLVPAVFGLAAPQAARLSVARWLLGSSERWPQQTYLTVMGLDARGRLLAPRDERFLMEVRSRPAAARRQRRPLDRRRPGRAARLESQAREARDARRGARPRADRRREQRGRHDGRGRSGAIPVRVSAVAVVVDLRAGRRRRLARADHGRARRPARAGRDALRVKEPGSAADGLRERRRPAASTCSSCPTPRSS